MSCAGTGPHQPGGCNFAEDPERSSHDARLFWEPALDPSVMIAAAFPAPPAYGEIFDLRRLSVRATVLQREGLAEEALLGIGARSIRLSIVAGTLLRGPVRLRFELPGLPDLEARLAAFRFLAALLANGRLPKTQPCTARRTARPELILRTLDALAGRASLRGIAVALFGADRVAADWDRPSDYLKSRVRRLVAQSRALAAGGYFGLLRP